MVVQVHHGGGLNKNSWQKSDGATSKTFDRANPLRFKTVTEGTHLTGVCVHYVLGSTGHILLAS